MKHLAIVGLLASTAAADVGGYAEGGVVVGSDFGAAAHDHVELGPRFTLGIDYAEMLGVFFAYRDMGEIDDEATDLTYRVHAWDAGFRAYLPMPRGRVFFDLALAHATVDVDSTFSTLAGFSDVRWGVGARGGAVVPLLRDDDISLSVGAAVGYARYVAGDDDVKLTSAMMVDAFVRIDVY